MMKLVYSLLTLLYVSSVVQAASPGAGLQADENLKKWKSDRISKHGSQYSLNVFYTGKPFDYTKNEFIFKFRNYEPAFARWTSSDPIGFLDGANNHRYASCPTSSFDFAGLLDWATLTQTTQDVTDPLSGAKWEVWTVKTDDGAHTVDVWKYISGSPSGTDYSYNCHGYTFAGGSYWIQSNQVSKILQGDGWTAITGSDKTGAKIALWETLIRQKTLSLTVKET